MDNIKISEIPRLVEIIFMYVAPGAIFLDMFLRFGLFSGTIFNLYDFLLYLIWSVIISTPFSFPTGNFIISLLNKDPKLLFVLEGFLPYLAFLFFLLNSIAYFIVSKIIPYFGVTLTIKTSIIAFLLIFLILWVPYMRLAQIMATKFPKLNEVIDMRKLKQLAKSASKGMETVRKS
jgi:TM2 domain-containing membrane protein YozV